MQTKLKNSGGRIANVIIIPLVTLIFLSVVGIFFLMHWSAHISDDSAQQSQLQLISGALQLVSDDLARQQSGVATWDAAFHITNAPNLDQEWVFDNITNWLYANHGFTKSAVVGKDYAVKALFAHDHNNSWLTPDLLARLKPAIAKVRARYIISFRRLPSGLYSYEPSQRDQRYSIFETGVVSVKGEPHLFSVAAIALQIQSVIPKRVPPTVMISLAPLRGEKMSEIMHMTRLDGFILAQNQTDREGIGQLRLRGPTGAPIGVIAWQVDRPGTQMLTRINPFLGMAAFMITAVVIAVTAFTRHMTKRLAVSEAQAVHTSRHDALSGLPNRAHFHRLLTDMLQDTNSRGRETAVIYIDLDHFKDINDTLGHSAGDMVIVAVAKRLTHVLGDNGIVARISGDEFAMMIPNSKSDEWLEYILDQIQDEISQPIKIGARELHASLSIGAAVAPRDGIDPDELLRKADIALYDAKENGRNRRSFFEANMEDHVQSKDKLSRELRMALKNDELSLAYQPQSDTAAQRIVSVEALARWTKEDGTVISPAQFIPVAEETGLINELGLWVLNKACAKAHDWPDVVMSVNVSPNQFKHPRFVEKVMAILATNNLAPQRLEIEVTESVFAGRNDTVLKSLRRLKNLGIKVALDDFGSGYSSLSYLRRFPFDTLKVDRDFLSDMDGNPEAEAIIVSIIQLGKALGMTIVAEGIETIEQIRFLQAHGCHRMQGYFISQPLNETDLAQFLEDFKKEHGGDFGREFAFKMRAAEV